jgi:hypothetical protein
MSGALAGVRNGAPVERDAEAAGLLGDADGLVEALLGGLGRLARMGLQAPSEILCEVWCVPVGHGRRIAPTTGGVEPRPLHGAGVIEDVAPDLAGALQLLGPVGADVVGVIVGRRPQVGAAERSQGAFVVALDEIGRARRLISLQASVSRTRLGRPSQAKENWQRFFMWAF